MLLALSATYTHNELKGGYNSVDLQRTIAALWPQLKESALLSMDRTSGLGLMTDIGTVMRGKSSWLKALARNQWLCCYMHLLARPDVVRSLATFQPSISTTWSHSLPFDRSTVSALRVLLSSAQPKRDGKGFDIFLNSIGEYIEVSCR